MSAINPMDYCLDCANPVSGSCQNCFCSKPGIKIFNYGSECSVCLDEPTDLLAQDPRHLAEPTDLLAQDPRHLAEPTDFLAQDPRYLAEPTDLLAQDPRHLAEPTDFLAQDPRYLAEPTDLLAQDPRHLAEPTCHYIYVSDCGHWICSKCVGNPDIGFYEGSKCLICQHTIRSVNHILATGIHLKMEAKLVPHFSKLAFRLKNIDTDKLDCNHGRTILLLNEYYKWLTLVAANPLLVPSDDIDSIWKLHILDTDSYRATCKQITKRFIDYKPNVDKLKHFAATLQAYRDKYGQMSPQAEPFWRLPNYYHHIYRGCKSTLAIKSYSLQTMRIPFVPYMTIFDMKQLIREETGIPLEQFYLSCRCHMLSSDNKTAADYFIDRDCTISLSLRMRGC